MNAARRQPGCWLAAPLVALLLPACQMPPSQAREDANRRWNAARAQVKVKLAADQFSVGNVPAAAGELREAQRLDPANPALAPLQARIWLAEGNVTAAAELLEQTRRTGKPQAEIEYLLGVVRQQQQQWEAALEAYDRAVELDPAEIAYLLAATQARLQLGQTREALNHLQAAEPRFGWTSAYQAALAECCEQTGDWSAAVSAWQRAAAVPDAAPALRERLAVALYRAGRYTEAVPLLRELLDEGADEADVWRLTLIRCYLATGQPAAARSHIELLLRQRPDDVRTLRLLAHSLAAGGELGSALRTAQRALAANAQDRETLELVAALAWKAGDRELAGGTASRLLQADPGNVVARHLLARLNRSSTSR